FLRITGRRTIRCASSQHGPYRGRSAAADGEEYATNPPQGQSRRTSRKGLASWRSISINEQLPRIGSPRNDGWRSPGCSGNDRQCKLWIGNGEGTTHIHSLGCIETGYLSGAMDR